MATKGSGLGDFLASLSEDQDSLAAYHRDPHGFLESTDLEVEHVEALKSGDVVRIRQILHEEHRVGAGGGAPRPMFVIIYRTAGD